jgi:GT2 family glycosyltransferase
MRVTLGVCVKDSERTIEKCLRLNVINQDFQKKLMEVIVVDGNSKDKTVEIARNAISGSGVVADFLSDKGEGLGVARQIVLDHAHTEYVVWIDGDVLFSRDFVKNIVTFMDQNPQVCVATGRYVYPESADVTLPASLQNLYKHVGSIEFVQKKEYQGLPPNDACIYRLRACKQVGGFDKRITGAGEDLDIIIRMMKKGWKISVDKSAKYYTSPREKWGSLWVEKSWFGKGIHYVAHKHPDLHIHTPNILLSFIIGCRGGLKAYKLTLERKALLFSLYHTFVAAAKLHGFIEGHIEEYGHGQTDFDFVSK